MNGTQRKHLKERIDEAARILRSRLWDLPEEPEPDAVKAARQQLAKAEKVIDAWEAKQTKKREALRARIRQEERQAREALLFADAKLALAAVKKFEAKLK